MQAHDTVLCIQDGTRLNFTRRGQTQGLGAIGSNQTGAVARGLELHTTLAVNPDGVALGGSSRLRRARGPRGGSRRPAAREAARGAQVVPLDRGTARLRAGGRATVRDPRGVRDGPRGRLPRPVRRAPHGCSAGRPVGPRADRVLGREKTPDGQTVSRRLFDTVRNAPARGAAQVEVQRLSARVKASKQARKDRRAARVADVTLRYQQVALPCPDATPVALWVVHVREEQPPAAVEPLEWFLLTTLRVTSPDDAARILQWYARRWRIEEYFRVLKSGCKVEELQHHSAERLERAMAIKMVIGWRIQLMVQLGRGARPAGRPAVLRWRVARARHLRPLTQAAAADAPRRRGRSGSPRRVARTATRPAHSCSGTATPNVAMAFAFELRDEFG